MDYQCPHLLTAMKYNPEHFTASLVGHHSARSSNKLTYGLYSAGISDAQKREIVDGIRLSEWEDNS
jgi:hypothetical protein